MLFYDRKDFPPPFPMRKPLTANFTGHILNGAPSIGKGARQCS